MTARQLMTTALIAAAIACVACSSATRRTGGDACALSRTDSVYLERGPAYRDCAVTRRARLLTTDIHPDFRLPNASPGQEICYNAIVEFVVDTAGLPEFQLARVVRSNNASFAAAVIAILPRWRYQPALKDNMAVRQIVQEKQSIDIQVIAVRQGEAPRPQRPRC